MTSSKLTSETSASEPCEEEAHSSVAEEDAPLARAIDEGLLTKPVSKRYVISILQSQ